MYIHVARFALQALTKQSVQKRTTMIAKRKPLVVVNGKSVWHVYVKPLSYLLKQLLFDN